MPRLRPAPRLLREAAEYRADIARLRPGRCALCGEAGSAGAPLLAFAPQHDPSVRIELHARCQPIWYLKRGASPVIIIVPETPPMPKAIIVPQRHHPIAMPRHEMMTVPPNDAA